MLHIVHLIDDTQPGGVMRYLDFLTTAPQMTTVARHSVVPVKRTRPGGVPADADVIVSHLTITWRGLPGLLALRARHPATPLVHIEHSYCAGFAAANVRAPGRFHTLLRAAYALFDRVVAVSEGQADWLLRRDLVKAEVLSVIPPCVDLSAFRALTSPRGPIRNIGAIGRFDPQKGFDILVKAFRQVADPDATLTLFGDGPQRAELERLAAGDPRIAFPGFAADPVRAIGQCDAIAMPSRWEPYGIVAAETLASGRPLLAAGVDGLTDQRGDMVHFVRGHGLRDWTDALENILGRAPMATGTAGQEDRTLNGWRALLAQIGGAADRPERQEPFRATA